MRDKCTEKNDIAMSNLFQIRATASNWYKNARARHFTPRDARGFQRHAQMPEVGMPKICLSCKNPYFSLSSPKWNAKGIGRHLIE